ncbi:cytotoxic and regulatory T-cell molecule isoform X2 [Cheilinus undulatus]|uniref:cytotoxic and regulatory T-cell molecule isoform X2 n=1 Tax=Cheilinus undulatus TaxID=241271 RepID=UPI001BD64D92|nr:cytotoxic and regulatory T-cell molecule isoform X2 [Cheilinus undulatus]
MKQQLQLSVFMLLLHASLAVWQRMTVTKGETVHLICPISNAESADVEWRNPKQQIMFYKSVKASKDKRYRISKLSSTEFSISISNVNFEDGGRYTCTQYGTKPTVKEVELTVRGRPRISIAKHDGQFVLECTAEGNHRPPQISWRFNNGPEFQMHTADRHDGKTFTSMQQITMNPFKKTVTVKCLVRHLHSQPLMTFVTIEPKTHLSPYHTITRPPTAPPVEPTESWTTASTFTTTDQRGTTPDSSVRESTSSMTRQTITPADSPLSPTDESRTSESSASTRGRNDSDSNATSPTGWISVTMTTEETTSFNQTEGNRTVSLDNQEKQGGHVGSSSVLVLLVTILIVGLLVVVIFFTIKLRRAHIAWKRENEDSDPSEESSKSKSSQEERNAQGQRRRGLINTAFTQYVVEEPTAITSVVNTAAITEVERVTENTSDPQTPGQTSASSGIKETEL